MIIMIIIMIIRSAAQRRLEAAGRPGPPRSSNKLSSVVLYSLYYLAHNYIARRPGPPRSPARNRQDC